MGTEGQLVLGFAADLVATRHLLGGFAHHLTGGPLGDLRPLRQNFRERHELREHAQHVGGRGLTEGERRHGVDDFLRQLDLGVRGRIASSGDDHVGFTPFDRVNGTRDRLQTRSASACDGECLD